MDFFQEAREMGILSVIGEQQQEEKNTYRNKSVLIKYLSYILPGANIVGMLTILIGSFLNITNEYYTTFVISSVVSGLIIGIISTIYVFASKESKYEKEISIIGVSSFLPLLAIMIVSFFTYLF